MSAITLPSVAEIDATDEHVGWLLSDLEQYRVLARELGQVADKIRADAAELERLLFQAYRVRLLDRERATDG